MNFKYHKKRIARHVVRLMLAVCGLMCSVHAAGSGDVPPDVLRRQCAESYNNLDYTRAKITAAKLLDVASRRGDRLNMGYANMYIGAADLFTGRLKQAMPRLDKAMDLGRETGDDTLMALACNVAGIYEISANLNAYTAQHYFLESLGYSKKARFDGLLGSIYGNLASVSLMQGDTTGINYARECYNLGKKGGQPRNVFVGANHLAAIYHYMKRDSLALKYVKEALDIQTDKGYTDVSNLYVLYSSILEKRGDYAKAEAYARRAVDAAMKHLPPSLPDCYLQYARVMAARRMYAESNRTLEKAVAAAESSNVFTAIVDIYELMADNYEAMGDMKKALEYVRMAKDSAAVADKKDKERLVNERKLVLDITKKEQEAALGRQRLESQRKLNIALSVAVAMLAVMLVMAYLNARNKNRLYKNIVMQHTKAMAREDELRRRIDDLAQDAARDGKSHAARIDEGKSAMMYRSLCELMEKERLYADSQLNRESLAEKLGTNRTYLSQVITDNGGVSYPQFVNTYRVNEAVRVLSDRSKADYPLKQLCSDIGFSSLSTFYKIFKEQVGITPSAYRKSYADIEEHGGE